MPFLIEKIKLCRRWRALVYDLPTHHNTKYPHADTHLYVVITEKLALLMVDAAGLRSTTVREISSKPDGGKNRRDCTLTDGGTIQNQGLSPVLRPALPSAPPQPWLLWPPTLHGWPRCYCPRPNPASSRKGKPTLCSGLLVSDLSLAPTNKHGDIAKGIGLTPKSELPFPSCLAPARVVHEQAGD